ncbi:hypothetical protein AVEN_29098-1 [Araneus ventricosus]|uniref:Uncharacterized protein n=1 Tax=Araneus ventricosus TaxID=182803 RepID=A0A4Y2ALF6_ARAVE|nr:hypothetical protein AVEN_29098-1 [Araneus ventricosus]
MDTFGRLDTIQEAISEMLLGDEQLSKMFDDDFAKAEEYRYKLNQFSAELEYIIKMKVEMLPGEIVAPHNATRKFKLPKLELTKSTDELKDYVNF